MQKVKIAESFKEKIYDVEELISSKRLSEALEQFIVLEASYKEMQQEIKNI
jgi:hypothetical protein